MELFIITILANIIILYMILYSKIYINFKYLRVGSDDYIAIHVYLLRKVLSYSMEIPIVQFADIKSSFWLESKIKIGKNQDATHIKREQRFVKKTLKFYIMHPRELKELAHLFHYYARLYCRLMGNVINSLYCEQFYWKTIYGLEDVAVTAIINGVIWNIKSLILARIKKNVMFKKKPVISVTPILGQNSITVDFQCIFSIRLGNIIFALKNLYSIKESGEEINCE